ncbi:2-oxoglutarate (2OG) and Fe(II)-dependent oxygenase superfamily protein [Artemisia annua]|uniref:2-oxoglutarate (2OG) and Fe(II)-dependent oxygenase superfamily protein n=1 Tax=Artemisia annua TaxID=35608 RepID=A0A2U1L2H9_ARTAN|nr:2-oxoglutarate (2OG) and Fe(II)-dependent oxygenase superfamily protein [Artemisia annua]
MPSVGKRQGENVRLEVKRRVKVTYLIPSEGLPSNTYKLSVATLSQSLAQYSAAIKILVLKKQLYTLDLLYTTMLLLAMSALHCTVPISTVCMATYQLFNRNSFSSFIFPTAQEGGAFCSIIVSCTSQMGQIEGSMKPLMKRKKNTSRLKPLPPSKRLRLEEAQRVLKERVQDIADKKGIKLRFCTLKECESHIHTLDSPCRVTNCFKIELSHNQSAVSCSLHHLLTGQFATYT